MQKNILFHISDGIHNFGSMMLKIEDKNIETKYFNKLNRFFSISRTLALNVSKDLYSEEALSEKLDMLLPLKNKTLKGVYGLKTFR